MSTQSDINKRNTDKEISGLADITGSALGIFSALNQSTTSDMVVQDERQLQFSLDKAENTYNNYMDDLTNNKNEALRTATINPAIASAYGIASNHGTVSDMYNYNIDTINSTYMRKQRMAKSQEITTQQSLQYNYMLAQQRKKEADEKAKEEYEGNVFKNVLNFGFSLAKAFI